MKILMVTLSTLALSSAALAVTCPTGSKQAYACTTAPQPSDTDGGAPPAETVAVCTGGADATIFLGVGTEVSKPLTADVSTIPGGVTYTLTVGIQTAPMTMALSIPLTAPSPKVNATFTISQAGQSAVSTYTCDVLP